MPKHKSSETVDDSSSSDSGPDPEPAPKKQKEKEKKTLDDDSDSEEEKAPAPKKQKEEKKKRSREDDDEQDHMYALSRQKFVNVREFRGRILIDIREYYESGGDMKPGKKGISLTIEQWRKLESKMEEINESIQALA